MEQARKPENKRKKRAPKPDATLNSRNKGSYGGIDWYRYQTFVLLPRLILFIHKIIEKYGEAILVQDGAPAYCSW